MGIEIQELKDIATITMTATEVASVLTTLAGSIRKPGFQAELGSLTEDIEASYRVVLENLAPFMGINTQAEFDAQFAQQAASYGERYLMEISRPRELAENTFQKNLQFWKIKETKTSFPLFKLTFQRLREFIDKWIDNDIWLAMTIDSLFKNHHRLLGQVSQLAQQDNEQGFLYFRSSILAMQPLVSALEAEADRLASVSALACETPVALP